MKFVQLNTHKAQLAAIELHNELELVQEVVLITEPYTYKNKMVGIPTGYTPYIQGTVEDAKPRAAVLLPHGITAVKLEQFCNRDSIILIVDTLTGKLIVGSIYLDILQDVIPQWLEALMIYIEREGVKMILGVDTNAHSQLYGPDTNKRGELLEEFIFTHGIFVENIGTIPTFEVYRQGQDIQTHIDATLTRGEVKVINWGVDQSYNASDHNTIRWEIPDEPPPVPLIRPWHKAKWDVFTKEMSKQTLEYPDIFTEKKLDRLTVRFTAAIRMSLDIACPLKEASKGKKKSDWYTEDLRLLANKVRRQYHNATRSKSQLERMKYKKIQKKYQIMCRKAKRKSWRAFLDTTPDETKMAAINKIIQGKNTNTSSTFIKEDGTATEPGEETLNQLVKTHFPAAVESIPHKTYSPTTQPRLRKSKRRMSGSTRTQYDDHSNSSNQGRRQDRMD